MLEIRAVQTQIMGLSIEGGETDMGQLVYLSDFTTLDVQDINIINVTLSETLLGGGIQVVAPENSNTTISNLSISDSSMSESNLINLLGSEGASLSFSDFRLQNFTSSSAEEMFQFSRFKTVVLQNFFLSQVSATGDGAQIFFIRRTYNDEVEHTNFQLLNIYADD